MGLTGILAEAVPSASGTGGQAGGAPAVGGSSLKGLLAQDVPDQKQFQVAPAPNAPPPGQSMVDYEKAKIGTIQQPTTGSFVSDLFGGLADASKKVSSAIIDTPATWLADTSFMKNWATAAPGAKLTNDTKDPLTGKPAPSLTFEGILNVLSGYGGGFLSGATGGAYSPQENTQTGQLTGFPGMVNKTISLVGQGVGMFEGIKLISAITAPVATPQKFVSFLNQYPKVAKYAIPLIQNAVGFGIYGQLDPHLANDIGKRAEKLAVDIGVSPVYTALGFIKSPAASMPASFGLGFGMAKFSGASNSNAIASGIAFAILDGAARSGQKPDFVTGRKVDEALQAEALTTLNRYAGSNLTGDSSPEEIQAAYRMAAKSAHPDLGGTDQDFNAVQSAFDYLNGKGTSVAKAPAKSLLGLEDAATAKARIETSAAFDIDRAIESGDIKASDVYSDPEAKILTPQFAEGRISDVAQKLDGFQEGLGKTYTAEIDPKNTTMAEIVAKGEQAITTAQQSPGSRGFVAPPKVGDAPVARPNPYPAAAPEGLPQTHRDILNLNEAKTRLAAGQSPQEVTYALGTTIPQAKAEQIVQQAQAEIAAGKPHVSQEPAPAAAPAPSSAAEILPKPEDILSQTPAKYQAALDQVEQTTSKEITDLQTKVGDLEKQVAEAKPQSAEKRDLKIQLSDAKGKLQDAQLTKAQPVQEHAATFKNTVSEHLQKEHGVSAEHAAELTSKVAEHITEPELVRQHAHTTVADIAKKVAVEFKASQKAKGGAKSVVKGKKPPSKAVEKKVETKEFPTVHEGGVIKMVQGEPVKITDGIETFLHEGNAGWIVSESSTGRFLADSRTKEGAVAKAKASIEKVGAKKFAELIEKNKLPAKKEDKAEIEKATTELKKAYADSGLSKEEGFTKADEELSNILTELDLSEPGQRLVVYKENEPGVTGMGVPSTFPKWLPERNRSKALFSKVWNNLEVGNLKYPEGVRSQQRELYDSILAELDKRLEINTAPIRDKIMAQYGQKAEVGFTGESNIRNGRGENNRGVGKKKAGSEVDFSKIPEKAPRDQKPKPEKKAETPKEPLNPREIVDMVREIEKNKPKGWVGTALKEVSTLFNPVGQADSAAVDVIMRNKGEYERAIFRTERTTKEVKNMWDKQPEAARLDFMDKVETGRMSEIAPEFRPLAEMYRARLDQAHAAVVPYKNINFLENFFPHFWKDAKAVEDSKVWAKANAKRPLQGNKSFTKERIFATIQDGVKAGYKLETSNPEELVQIYEQNVGKFVMANKIKEDMLARGFWKTVRSGSQAPEGFARIDDPISKVYLNPNIPILEAYDEEATNKLDAVIQKLGIENVRKYEIERKGSLGFTQKGSDKITTKFATPLSVKAHELGHNLQYRYEKEVNAVLDAHVKEIRALADMRIEGHEVTSSHKDYIRSSAEKAAVMLEALIHAPELFEKTAPGAYKDFTDFLGKHEELKPLLDIKPSLVLGVREDTVYAGGAVLGAEHWAVKDVARLINNYLSRDHLMDTAIGKGIMNVKNSMNAFELGFSAFHLTMETLDTMITKFAIGLGKISQKNWSGFGDMLMSPVTPISYFQAGRKFYNGDPELLKIEKDLFTGGASLREKQYYKNTVFDTFNKNNREMLGMIKRGELLGAGKAAAFNILRIPMAAVEATMRPLFTYYIPRLKVGAFRDVFAAELERNSSRIQDGTISRETLARGVWNNIENRMGELNYDNLFWDRNLKTGLMLATRAVGWNLGTVRELGGAVPDAASSFGFTKEGREDFKKHGFNFTPKMGYTVSLFIFVATLGAIYQYLHTGKKPSSVKDLFYPQNGATTASGDPYRVEFPTYLKDIYQSGVPQLASGDPFGGFDSFASMLKNKSAPELSAILDIMGNRDFYGNEIRNPHDNNTTQAKQVALYLLSTLTPFTIQQQQNLAAGKSTLEQQAEAFFGIIKAPSAVIQSDYEKQIAALYQDQVGLHSPETPEQAAQYDAKQMVVDAIKKGDYSGIQKLVSEGIIKPSGVRTFIQNAVLTTQQKQYKGLSPENKAKVQQKKP